MAELSMTPSARSGNGAWVSEPGQIERIDARVGGFTVLRRALAVLFIFLRVLLRAVADRIWLRRLWCWIRRVPYERLSVPRQLRNAFELLGPTYIKFGQMIASSEGLFPRELSIEFRKCLDRVPPFSSERAHAILEEELGRKLGDVFARLDDTPVAAASIAQVYLGVLHQGQEVAVKIQRPNLQRRVAADMRIMRLLSRVLSRVSRRIRLGNLVGIVDDFALTLAQEMDFRLEARNMDAFNALFPAAQGNKVCAPHVYWELTSRRVLIMERFRGRRVDDPDVATQLEDPEGDLVAGVVAWFRSILEGGFFHGDVHAGNLMFLEDGRIGFLDFGIIGRFDTTQRAQAMGFLLSLAMRDFKGLSQIVLDMGSALDPSQVDRDALAKDLKTAYEPLVGMTMGELNYQEVLPAILRTSMRHSLKFPQEFILITKQLLYFDRYARQLAPKLNFFTDPRIVGVVMSKLPEMMGPQRGALSMPMAAA